MQLRDRYERTFALALLLVLGVAVFELLPRFVFLYNQIRVRHYSIGVPWREYLAVGTTAMASLTVAPKLLSMLRGAWRRLAMIVIAIGGVLGPLLMGWSFDRFHSYSTALLGLAAAMLTGAAVLASLPRYPAPSYFKIPRVSSIVMN